jgi:hypothetical protein
MARNKTVYRRVGIFQSLETHIRSPDGEWFRDDEESTPSVPVQINKFAEDEQVEIVHISQPSIELVGKSASKRQYRTAVSVIYVPAELIDYGEEETGVTTRDIALPETPEEIYGLMSRSLTEQLRSDQRR